MFDKEISVCVPVKNEESTISQTLDSVVNNGFEGKMEVLVCVNGSTDNTMNLVRDYSKMDGRVQVFESEPGKANAWNKLMDEVTNDTVFFIDGDVLIKKGSFKAMYDELKNSKKIAIAASRYKDFSSLIELHW